MTDERDADVTRLEHRIGVLEHRQRAAVGLVALCLLGMLLREVAYANGPSPYGDDVLTVHGLVVLDAKGRAVARIRPGADGEGAALSLGPPEGPRVSLLATGDGAQVSVISTKGMSMMASDPYRSEFALYALTGSEEDADARGIFSIDSARRVALSVKDDAGKQSIWPATANPR